MHTLEWVEFVLRGVCSISGDEMLPVARAAIPYVVAGHFIRRRPDEIGIPKGMTRGLWIFAGARAVAGDMAALLDGMSR